MKMVSSEVLGVPLIARLDPVFSNSRNSVFTLPPVGLLTEELRCGLYSHSGITFIQPDRSGVE